ncbi:hypothetical protein AYI70_g4023, partial [Smittium culicis]
MWAANWPENRYDT